MCRQNKKESIHTLYQMEACVRQQQQQQKIGGVLNDASNKPAQREETNTHVTPPHTWK